MRIRGSDKYRIINGVRTFYNPDNSSKIKKETNLTTKGQGDQRPNVILLELLNQYAETGKIDISKFFKLKEQSSDYLSIKQKTLDHILHKKNVNANNFFEAYYYQNLYYNLESDFTKQDIYNEKIKVYRKKAEDYKQYLRIARKKYKFLEIIKNEVIIPSPDFKVGNIVSILDYPNRKRIAGIRYDLNEQIYYYKISANSDVNWVSSVFIDNSKIPLVSNTITIPYFSFEYATFNEKTYKIEAVRYDLIEQKYFYMISVNSNQMWFLLNE